MEKIRIISLVTQPGHGGIEVVSKHNMDAEVVYLNSKEEFGFFGTQYGAIIKVFKIIKYIRTSDVIVTNLPFHHVLVSFLSMFFRGEHVAVEHGPWVHVIGAKGGFLLTILYQFWLRRSSTKVVCVAKDLYALYNLVRENNIYIPNGVRVLSPGISPPDSILEDDNKLRLVFVGRFDLQKNVGLAIDVAFKLKELGFDLSLDLYGDGAEFCDYKSKYSSSDMIRFNGYKPNVLEDLNDNKILLITSKFEGLPGVVLEAMTRGCKVVSVPFISGLMELNSFESLFVSDSTNVGDIAKEVLEAHEAKVNLANVSALVSESYSIENSRNRYARLFEGMTE